MEGSLEDTHEELRKKCPTFAALHEIREMQEVDLLHDLRVWGSKFPYLTFLASLSGTTRLYRIHGEEVGVVPLPDHSPVRDGSFLIYSKVEAVVFDYVVPPPCNCSDCTEEYHRDCI